MEEDDGIIEGMNLIKRLQSARESKKKKMEKNEVMTFSECASK